MRGNGYILFDKKRYIKSQNRIECKFWLSGLSSFIQNGKWLRCGNPYPGRKLRKGNPVHWPYRDRTVSPGSKRCGFHSLPRPFRSARPYRCWFRTERREGRSIPSWFCFRKDWLLRRQVLPCRHSYPDTSYDHSRQPFPADPIPYQFLPLFF